MRSAKQCRSARGTYRKHTLLPDRVERLVGADEDAAAGDGGRAERFLAQFVGGENLEAVGLRVEHGTDAGLVQQVHLPVARDRRRRERALEPLLEDLLARLRV